MTRDEVALIYARVARITGRRVRMDEELVDEWHRALRHTHVHDAHKALDHLVAEGESHITLPRLVSAARAIDPRPVATASPGMEGCPECQGTGWSACAPEPDEPGVHRYAPCRTCLPEHPWNLRNRRKRA